MLLRRVAAPTCQSSGMYESRQNEPLRFALFEPLPHTFQAELPKTLTLQHRPSSSSNRTRPQVTSAKALVRMNDKSIRAPLFQFTRTLPMKKPCLKPRGFPPIAAIRQTSYVRNERLKLFLDLTIPTAARCEGVLAKVRKGFVECLQAVLRSKVTSCCHAQI